MFQQTKDNEDDWFGSDWKLRVKKEGSEPNDPKKHWNSGTDQYRELVEELQAVSVSSDSTITADTIAQKLAEAVEKGGTKFKELVTALKTHGQLSTATNPSDLAGNGKGLNKQEVKDAIKDLLSAEFEVTVEISNINAEAETSGNQKVTVTIGNSGDAKTASLKVGKSGNIDLVFEVKVDKDKNQSIAERLKKAAGSWNPGKELMKEEFGAPDNATVNQNSDTQNKVEVNAGGGSGSNTSSPEKVSVSITGSSGDLNFESLVCVLSEDTNFTGGSAEEVANTLAGKMRDATVTNLKSALNSDKCPDLKKKFINDGGTLKSDTEIATQLGGTNGSDNVAGLLLKNEFNLSSTPNVTGSGNIVNVIANPSGGSSGGNATVTVKKEGGSPESSDITISVTKASSANQANAIASALALALVNPKVKEAAQKQGVTISLVSLATSEVKIEVTNAISNSVARRIARRLAYSLKDKITSISMDASTLKDAIGADNQDPNNVKKALAGWINFKYFTRITKENIRADVESGGKKKVKVEIGESGPSGTSDADVVSSGTNQGVKVTIPDIGGDEDDKRKKATEIANRIAGFVAVAALTQNLGSTISSKDNLNAGEIQTALDGAKTQLKNLVQGYNGADVYNSGSSGISVPTVQGNENKVTVEFKMSTKFNDLVTQLKSEVSTQLAQLNSPSSADKIADALADSGKGLNKHEVKEAIKALAQSMVGTEKAGKVENVGVSKDTNDNSKVTVKISDGTGSEPKGEASVMVTHTNGKKASVVINVMSPGVVTVLWN